MAQATPAAPTRQFPHVEGVEHRFVQAGELRMHIAEAGPRDGEPLLMLHGWPQHWYMWRYVIPALSERFRLIMPDLRGSGWSEAPPDGYEKENMAEDVVKLLDALGLERVRLMGHDWGGWIGFILCLNHPERVERFMPLNIPHPWQRRSLPALLGIWRFWYMFLISTPGLGTFMLRRFPGFVGLIVTGTSTHPERFPPEDVKAFTEPIREPARAHATAKLYRTFIGKEFAQVGSGRYRSKRLQVPTLLLFGMGDFAISTRSLDGFSEFADDMHVELVDDSGHFVAEDRPDVVAPRALEFFAAAAGGRREGFPHYSGRIAAAAQAGHDQEPEGAEGPG